MRGYSSIVWRRFDSQTKGFGFNPQRRKTSFSHRSYYLLLAARRFG